MALYHSAKGGVDYTIVGSPTIVDGIASGFSKSDYLTLPSITNDFIKKLNQSSEIGIKLTTPTEEISQYAVQAFFIPYNGTGSGFSFYKEGKKIRWTILTNYYIETPSFNDGETVWLKGIRDNGIAELLYRTNGTSYISAGTLDISNVEDPSAYGTNAIPKIGINGNTASGWKYTGSIDLNETYIKVDGQPWFGVCPVEVQKHQLKGPVGYTVVGSPTIVNGIASGFSKSDYLTLPAFPKFDDIEFVFLLKSGWTKNSSNILSFISQKYFIAVENDNTIQASFLNSLTGNRLILRTDNTIDNINDIYIKVYYSNNSQYIAISENGQTWNILKSSAESFSENISGDENSLFHNNSGGYFHGSIDLNETYIKVNGKLWFYQPADTKYIVKDGKLVWADPRLALSGPVNYTVVGTPTIVDGVVSGFSDSDYLYTDNTLNWNDNVEFVVKFKTPSSFSVLKQLIYSAPIFMYCNQSGGFSVMYGISPNIKYLNSLNNLQTNTIYYAKLVRNTESFSLYLKQENTDYELQSTRSDVLPTNNYYVMFGKPGSSAYNSWDGSIDLNQTYIKVNNQLWFYGKNYATQNIAPVPAGYTFGNTTTPSIGYVDMRTQEFTAAPHGATIGRDE